MVDFCAIPYLILAMIIPCIAIWAVPKKRGRGILADLLLSTDNPFIRSLLFLVIGTIGLEIAFAVIFVVESENDPLSIVLAISIVHIILTIGTLWMDKRIGDAHWQYTALGDVPVDDIADTCKH
jgi:hypothetical protein